jgi:mannose-6-phosphate isomerase
VSPHPLAAQAERARAWLFEQALPVWARHGVNPRGGFHDRLDADYRPSGDLRLRVQARQTYVFAEAGRLGWSGPWRPLVEQGLAFLLHRARLESGLVASKFDVDGAVLPGDPDLYDQAFALFAFAHAYQVLGDERAREAALSLRGALPAHPLGGFAEISGPGLNANPQMHLLEAALAWTALDAGWTPMADGLVRLCHERLVDSETGALREHLSDDGTPAAGERGDVTDPGHHFEWAWLLDRRSGGEDPMTAALAQHGEAAGVDPARGVAMLAVAPDGRRLDGTARLWAQGERLRAALIMRGRPRAAAVWDARAVEAFDALFAFIDPAPRGLWLDRMEEDGSLRQEPAPASSLYHIMGACSALLHDAGGRS